MRYPTESQSWKNIVCGLIVVYKPDSAVLSQVVNSLTSIVREVLIFDNSDDIKINRVVNLFESENISVFTNHRNEGIGYAQNILIRMAIDRGYQYSLISDQDTIYPKDFIDQLLPVFSIKNNIAAVVPGWVDLNDSIRPKVQGQYVINSRGKLGLNHNQPTYLEITHAIASGMIIKLEAIKKIGLMREEMFIDWIDNEWCWRAQENGFIIAASYKAKVLHRLGDKTVKCLGKQFVKRSCVRNYYIVRNAVYLILHCRIKKQFKIYLAKKILHHVVFSLLVSEKVIEEFSCLAKSLKDGVCKKLGQIN